MNIKTAAQRTRDSRWASRVENTTDKLLRLVRDEIPNSMESVPRIDPNFFIAVDALKAAQNAEIEAHGGEFSFNIRPKQRDVMRDLYNRLEGDREKCIRVYAMMDGTGEVFRQSKSQTSEQYAAALWADGISKGWIIA